MLSILSGWFDECVTSHEKCIRTKDSGSQEATKPHLPTRILNVRSELYETIVRLVEPHGIRDDYVTLSHCWGPPTKRLLCTTKATLHQYLAGIHLSQLPKTFYDAVTIIRSTNLRYVWIDSLCLVQDDLNDWSKEAPRMGELYSNADLVIAALGAHDSIKGCFLKRISPEPFIDIQYVREGGAQDGYVRLNMKRYSDRHMGPISEPLGKEAGYFKNEP